VSYLDLYEAVERAVDQDLLARSAGSLFQLQVPRLDPVRLAQEVRAFHAPSVAAVATLLLHGPVTITDRTFPARMSGCGFSTRSRHCCPTGTGRT